MRTKILLWGTGHCFNKYIYFVELYEAQKNYKVIGVTSDNSGYMRLRNYAYINKENLSQQSFDVLIIMAEGNSRYSIQNEAIALGIDDKKIIFIDQLLHYNFDIKKYLKIKNHVPTIFSNNCWGGLTYHYCNMQFMSPFINMFVLDKDYIQFLKNPEYYIGHELELVEMKYNSILNIYFPLVQCGDIRLWFNHYDSFEKAKECWERRKKRINWHNILVMMFTEDPQIASEFAVLPYEKKVCFVPFASEEKSLCHVEYCKDPTICNLEFWDIVTRMAAGRLIYYDVYDLLEKGQIKRLVEFID